MKFVFCDQVLEYTTFWVENVYAACSAHVEYIGYLAAFLGVIAFVPQVITTWKAKSASNVSLTMYIIYCTSVLLWLTYGILIGSLPLISAEILTFCLAISILIMKCVWK